MLSLTNHVKDERGVFMRKFVINSEKKKSGFYRFFWEMDME